MPPLRTLITIILLISSSVLYEQKDSQGDVASVPFPRTDKATFPLDPLKSTEVCAMYLHR